MTKKYYGHYRAVVSNTKDPERRGRIKVLCPSVLDDTTESAWCDPCVAVAYDKGGDWCLPQKEETIWICFEEGDVNKPIYLGNWWSQNKTPLTDSYDSKKDKVRMIQYEGCIILMEDGKLSINVEEGSSEIVVENGKVTLHGNLIVDGNLTVKNIISTGSISSTGNISSSGSISASGTVSGSNIE